MTMSIHHILPVGPMPSNAKSVPKKRRADPPVPPISFNAAHLRSSFAKTSRWRESVRPRNGAEEPLPRNGDAWCSRGWVDSRWVDIGGRAGRGGGMLHADGTLAKIARVITGGKMVAKLAYSPIFHPWW